jgi:hypothetical protein
MGQIPAFSDRQLESLSRLLGDCGTGTGISQILSSLGLEDVSGESTKWRRIYATFAHYQRQDRAPCQHRCESALKPAD